MHNLNKGTKSCDIQPKPKNAFTKRHRMVLFRHNLMPKLSVERPSRWAGLLLYLSWKPSTDLYSSRSSPDLFLSVPLSLLSQSTFIAHYKVKCYIYIHVLREITSLRFFFLKMVLENGAGGGGGDAAEIRAESEEEALSLCDLCIDNELEESQVPNDPSLSYRPQQQAEFFEFFAAGNKLHSDMCPADDIIVYGKLLPLKDQRLRSFIPQKPIDGVVVNRAARCRRSESLSELKSTARSDSIKTRAIRTSRSLDDRRRARSQSSFLPEINRNCSGKSDRSSASSSKVPKSRWQLLISGIGMVKCPPEMELRDMKNRQSRSSNPATLFPATPGPEAKSPASGSSWGLIKALSCMVHLPPA